MSKTFDFQTQLAVGKRGEELFLKRYPDLKALDGRKGDFIGYSKRKIELKTDSYDMNKTANFFIEKIRNVETGALGSIWQAKEHGVYYFCYMFEKQGYIYWFKVDDLIKHIEENEKTYKTAFIKNKGWAATGYLVPRASLEHLMLLKENVISLNERDE